MEKETCPFGSVFIRARNTQNITQWHAAVNSGYHVTNLCKVEQGTHQPGVNLALRLVSAIGLDAAGTGDFFEALWREPAETAPEALRNLRNEEPGMVVDFEPFSVEGLRSPFGPLLTCESFGRGCKRFQKAQAQHYKNQRITFTQSLGTNVISWFSKEFVAAPYSSVCKASD